jgi:hypothetical protein
VYELTAVDSARCTAFLRVEVLGTDVLRAAVLRTTAAGCANLNDGTAEIGVTGGRPPYSVTWGTGFTGMRANGLSAGSYDVTVVDGARCGVNLSVTIPAATDLSIQASVLTQPTFNTGGSISVEAAGGKTPYRYALNGATTTQSSGTFTGLPAGTHTLSVIDAAGCTRQTTLTLENQQINCPRLTNVQVTEVRDTSLSLRWGAVSVAREYQVRYRIKGVASWTNVLTTDTVYRIRRLNPETEYEVAVRVRCVNGDFGALSAIQTYTTLPLSPCLPPQNFNAEVGRNARAILTTWVAIPNTKSYEVDYRPAGSITFTTMKTSRNELNIPQLTRGTRYELRIRVECSTDRFSGYSSSVFFTLP